MRVLGQGSFASAYLAEQVGTDRKAVVKIAHAHLIHSDRGQMVRDRFSTEIRAATRVTHPNLVTIYTAGETDDGLPALAMEYLEGETLGQRLMRGDRLSLDDLILVFAQLSSALQRVHASHIIHRDVSPENVFLSQGSDGLAVKLLDFGIARLQDRAGGGKSIVGTPFYMAPEQLRGESLFASDVYSVGALLWWSLTGFELFSHITDLAQLIQHLQAQQEPPDPLEVCPSLPKTVAQLVASMLDHRAEKRPTMARFSMEWASAEQSIRQWGVSQQGRQIAVLLTDSPMASMVTTMLRSHGHTVFQPRARLSALHALAQLDAVVIDAELVEPNPISLAKHLEQELPHVQICVVSNRTFGAGWSSISARVFAVLPEELARLQQALAATSNRKIADKLTTEIAHVALGEIPELLAALSESATHNDSEAMIRYCERVERIAHLARLSDMNSLARTMRVLLQEHAVDEPQGFIDELQRSFREAFPMLIAAQEP